MNTDVAAALDNAAEHRHVGNTLLALSLVFVAAFAMFAPARDWAPALVAATGAIGFAMLARREWNHEAQWAYCAYLWQQEDAR